MNSRRGHSPGSSSPSGPSTTSLSTPPTSTLPLPAPWLRPSTSTTSLRRKHSHNLNSGPPPVAVSVVFAEREQGAPLRSAEESVKARAKAVKRPEIVQDLDSGADATTATSTATAQASSAERQHTLGSHLATPATRWFGSLGRRASTLKPKLSPTVPSARDIFSTEDVPPDFPPALALDKNPDPPAVVAPAPLDIPRPLSLPPAPPTPTPTPTPTLRKRSTEDVPPVIRVTEDFPTVPVLETNPNQPAVTASAPLDIPRPFSPPSAAPTPTPTPRKRSWFYSSSDLSLPLSSSPLAMPLVSSPPTTIEEAVVAQPELMSSSTSKSPPPPAQDDASPSASALSSLDDHVPPLPATPPLPSPKSTQVPPIETVKPAASTSSTSRFTLSLPLLGRAKIPLGAALGAGQQQQTKGDAKNDVPVESESTSCPSSKIISGSHTQNEGILLHKSGSTDTTKPFDSNNSAPTLSSASRAGNLDSESDRALTHVGSGSELRCSNVGENGDSNWGAGAVGSSGPGSFLTPHTTTAAATTTTTATSSKSMEEEEGRPTMATSTPGEASPNSSTKKEGGGEGMGEALNGGGVSSESQVDAGMSTTIPEGATTNREGHPQEREAGEGEEYSKSRSTTGTSSWWNYVGWKGNSTGGAAVTAPGGDNTQQHDQHDQRRFESLAVDDDRRDPTISSAPSAPRRSTPSPSLGSGNGSGAAGSGAATTVAALIATAIDSAASTAGIDTGVGSTTTTTTTTTPGTATEMGKAKKGVMGSTLIQAEVTVAAEAIDGAGAGGSAMKSGRGGGGEDDEKSKKGKGNISPDGIDGTKGSTLSATGELPSAPPAPATSGEERGGSTVLGGNGGAKNAGSDSSFSAGTSDARSGLARGSGRGEGVSMRGQIGAEDREEEEAKVHPDPGEEEAEKKVTTTATMQEEGRLGVEGGAAAWYAPWAWYSTSPATVAIIEPAGSQERPEGEESVAALRDGGNNKLPVDEEVGSPSVEDGTAAGGVEEPGPSLLSPLGGEEAAAAAAAAIGAEESSSQAETSRTQVFDELANPIEASIQANRSGWASFFTSRTFVKAIGYGAPTSQGGDVKRDENGVEVMDLDSDVESDAEGAETRDSRSTGPKLLITLPTSSSATAVTDFKATTSSSPKLNGGDPPATPLTRDEDLKRKVAHSLPITGKAHSAKGASPAASGSSTPTGISPSGPTQPQTTPEKSKSAPATPKRMASPSPSSTGGGKKKKAAIAGGPSSPPNLVLPTWADTFHTPPRNVVIRPPIPASISPSTSPGAQDGAGVGKLLGKTIQFVSGMLFSKQGESGRGQVPEVEGGAGGGGPPNLTARRSRRNTNPPHPLRRSSSSGGLDIASLIEQDRRVRFEQFGQELPKTWAVVEGEVAGKVGTSERSEKGSVGDELLGDVTTDPVVGAPAGSRPEKDVLRGCKRVVIIGVHGWFPGAMMRTVLGEPTGTSSKFANMMAQAVQEFAKEHEVEFEKVTKIPLEGEGTIERRVERLYSTLLANGGWMDDLREADVIFVATHSQGSVVSTHLLNRLLQDNVICTQEADAVISGGDPVDAMLGVSTVSQRKMQRVCCLALCGIHLGPLRYLSSSSLVAPYLQYFESTAARELFDFQNTESPVAKAYVNALENVLDNGIKMTYIASLNDQVVPIYSGIFTAASHPLILRALYIDGDAYHSSDFLSNLLVLLLRLRNCGISDSGLLAHLSEATAGSLNGVGHSRAYEDLSTYSLAVRYLFMTNNGSEKRSSLVIDSFNAAHEQNDYEIPWSLRDLIADDRVLHFFSAEVGQLRDAFREWQPKTTILRDLKRKLQPIQRLPVSFSYGSYSPSSRSKL